MSVCMMLQIVVPTNYRDHGHNHLYGKDSDGDNEQIMGKKKMASPLLRPPPGMSDPA